MRDGNLGGLTASTAGRPITIYDPWSTDTNTWARVPYPGNVLPQSRQSPLYKYLLAVTQLPTLPNVNPMVAPNYVGTYSPFTRSWTTASRIDQRFSDKDSFYGRYSQGNYSNRSQFYGLPSLDWAKVPGNTQGSFQPNKSFALSRRSHLLADLLQRVAGDRHAHQDGRSHRRSHDMLRLRPRASQPVRREPVAGPVQPGIQRQHTCSKPRTARASTPSTASWTTT